MNDNNPGPGPHTLTPDGKIKDAETLAIMKNTRPEDAYLLPTKLMRRLQMIYAILNCARIQAPDNFFLKESQSHIGDIIKEYGGDPEKYT